MTLMPGVNLNHPDLLMTYDLLAAGYTDKAITRMAKAGVLHRIRHGSYTWGARWPELDDRERRALLELADLRRAGSSVVLSHTSAAERLGAPVWDLPGATHLTRTDQIAGRHGATSTQHRGQLLAEDVTIRGGVPFTSGTRTAFDVMSITDVEHGLVVVNGLLNAGETTPELLARFAPRATFWPGTLANNIVLSLADGRCESAGESRTFYLCWAENLPMPIPQYEIRNRHGRIVARVDFAWPELGVFLEFDGRVKYLRMLRPGETASDAIIREKRREELVCGLTSWRSIRLGWADLERRPRTADRIRATLAGQPWAA